MISPRISTRRAFLQTGTGATLSAALLATTARPLVAHIGVRPEPVPPIDDPRLKALAQRGLDAARSAGATYVDVRLTHSFSRKFTNQAVSDGESMGVGVRALVDGYWGFASGPVWTGDELARLGRGAVLQAQAGARGGQPRLADLVPVPPVPDGHWTMPVERDPFDVWPTEIMDFLGGLIEFATTIPGSSNIKAKANFDRQEKVFSATTGSYCTQRVYRSAGQYSLELTNGTEKTGVAVDTLSYAGLGWELFQGQDLTDQMQQAAEMAFAELALPWMPVEVGRYHAVFDTRTIAGLLSSTIGAATELDRVMGFEANAGGTSYITSPVEMLRTLKIGAPLLSVSTNRHDVGAVGTVRWDDEGVEPVARPLVTEGMLTGFQTTRESAGWLNHTTAASEVSVRSSGSAYAPEGFSAPLTHTGNLVMAAGKETGNFENLVGQLGTGIAFRDVGIHMDFQLLNGYGIGKAFKVTGGKVVARLAGAGVLMRTPEFWKSLLAIGGSTGARRYGLSEEKGEPTQPSYHSVTAVPVAVKDVSVIDATRKV